MQMQAVILKILIIKSSTVAKNRFRDKNHSRSPTLFLKSAENTLFSKHFRYVRLTPCVRLEDIINHQYSDYYSRLYSFNVFLTTSSQSYFSQIKFSACFFSLITFSG